MVPEFALCFRGRLWDELVATGVELHDMGPVKFSRPWTVIRARMRLRSLLKRNHYDAVVCHACWPHAVFGSIVRKSKTKLVGWLHDALNGKHWLDKKAGKIGASLLIANSHYTASCSKAVFQDVRTETISYPVEQSPANGLTSDRNQVRHEFSTSMEDVVILQASRMDRWKGQDVLIRAIRTLRGLIGWTAWIAGGPQRKSETEYLNELKELA